MATSNGRYDINRDPLWNGQAEGPTGPGFSKEEVACYQVDHLGTPQELTDHEGNVAWAAQYKAWGQAKEVISEAARQAGISNPIRFQGQYFDEETGLHYNRHRYYDPAIGRFVSSDPIGLLGGSNLHQYAPNPFEWVDPLGLKYVSGPRSPTVRAGKDKVNSSTQQITESRRSICADSLADERWEVPW
jgi:RHS repeat-associated protein